MARKRKAKDIEADEPQTEETTEANGNGIGHNSKKAQVPLTDEQRQSLALQWKRQYEPSLAAKKKSASDHSNLCKKIKAELGDDGVDLIKEMILAETEEGEEELQKRVERQLRAARYMAASLGSQFEMFDQDRTPSVDRARAEGKRDGMAGVPMKPQYDPSVPQYDQYVEGYQEGQKAIFNIQREDDAALFEAAESGEEAAAVN